MSHKKIKSKEMVAKSKHQVLTCSTPEHQLDSPSRDSDSIYDSDAASPVPFLCTQDGAEGETDVVWNFYTPKSGTTKSNIKNTTPVTRKVRRRDRKVIDNPIPKRRTVKPSQKKMELFQELIELNELVNKPKPVVDKPKSDDDIFSDASDSSPRSGVKSRNRCLRKNVLSSKFIKTESESGLESDDSMNECLLKASQAIEENFLNYGPVAAKRPCLESNKNNFKSCLNVNMDQDSMDSILSNIKFESPNISKVKKCETHKLNNDSFDNLLSNLNDSALEKLSQMPLPNEQVTKQQFNNKEPNWSLKELNIVSESPSSTTIFGRHSSMPESPSINKNKPSTSGMAFGRYNSMPFNKSNEKIPVPGDSPIRCTPEEIRKKHQLAREKLLAKRVLPFTSTQQTNPSQQTKASQQTKPLQQMKPSQQSYSAPKQNSTQQTKSVQQADTVQQTHVVQQTVQSKFVPKKTVFQPKVPTINKNIEPKRVTPKPNTDIDIKLLIEKKRQEALMKLRKRQNK